MLIWGGGNPGDAQVLDTGGSYALGASTDDDGDGWAECEGDCNDDDASVFPGAAQLCDGLANDCNDPIWPAASSGELDGDGDGYVECAPWAGDAPPVIAGGDCDDTDPWTHPGAQEVNDGQDNQCPESAGYGVVDEISGTASFIDGSTFAWPAQQAATLYEVARSPQPDLSTDCLQVQTSGTSWIDAGTPVSGGVYHYLVRAVAPNVGSWGQDSAGSERSGVCSGGGL